MGETMKKMDGKTKDLTEENISEIKRIFPSCIREGKVDFEALRELLDKANIVLDEKEKYLFTWSGKQQSKRMALQQNSGTLLPRREESVDFDTTKNMIIEGDNLEAMRLLLKPYSGRIKMIYIDPPYNTGNDFVYKDDFSDNLKNYIDKSGQALESNPETKGRFHSDWLNMMYPRLKLAQNLLNDEGIIFVSIDDNEVHNLRMIMNEIFGEENLVVQLVWKKRSGGGYSNTFINNCHEYILLYSKEISKLRLIDKNKTEGELSTLYTLRDAKGIYKRRDLRKSGTADLREDRPTMYYEVIAPDRTKIFPKRQDGRDGRWSCGNEKYLELIENGDIEFVKNNGEWKVYTKERPYRDNGELKSEKYESIILDIATNTQGTNEMKELFPESQTIFEFPKPSNLIKHLLKMGSENNDIILDFFAGSGTSAHAVMNLNYEDDGKRKFILVQLPESTRKKNSDGTYEESDAWKAGYKTISEITKERVRRVIKKIKSESKQNKLGEQKQIDLGFKVFKLGTSNIRAWDPDPKNLQATLEGAVSNMKDGRSDEDKLYEIMLKYGVDLTTSVKVEKIDGKTIYNVGEGYLYICLDKNLTKLVIEHITKDVKSAQTQNKARVVFADACFKDDQDAVNAEIALKKAGVEDIRRI